jgi:hypothetical protein
MFEGEMQEIASKSKEHVEGVEAFLKRHNN